MRSLGKKVQIIFRVLISIFIRRTSINGNYWFLTFGEVFNRYQILHLITVSEATRLKLLGRARRSFTKLLDQPMSTLDPECISDWIEDLKISYIQGPYSKRYSFHKELKDLKGILQWWNDQYDFKFKNPVRPFHHALSVMEDIPEKDRKISTEETLQFFQSMESQSLYQDLAIVQFYCAGRIGEIARIQVKNINLKLRTLKIKEVLIWINGIPKVKKTPKNDQSREVFINDALLKIFKRRLKQVPNGCAFLFHDSGQPLRYNRINVAFNDAWKKAGLSGKFSGSHLLRYSSAQTTRKITGSLDAVAAVTGHQSMKMAEHYGKLDSTDLNQSSLREMEKHVKRLETSKAA